MPIKLPVTLSRPLQLLGEASYSVYMLHPLVFFASFIVMMYVRKRMQFATAFEVILDIVTTLIVSYFVYNHIEKYFMKFGRTSRKQITESGI